MPTGYTKMKCNPLCYHCYYCFIILLLLLIIIIAIIIQVNNIVNSYAYA